MTVSREDLAHVVAQYDEAVVRLRGIEADPECFLGLNALTAESVNLLCALEEAGVSEEHLAELRGRCGGYVELAPYPHERVQLPTAELVARGERSITLREHYLQPAALVMAFALVFVVSGLFQAAAELFGDGSIIVGVLSLLVALVAAGFMLWFPRVFHGPPLLLAYLAFEVGQQVDDILAESRVTAGRVRSSAGLGDAGPPYTKHVRQGVSWILYGVIGVFSVFLVLVAADP